MARSRRDDNSDRLLAELATGLSRLSGRDFQVSDGRVIGPGTTEVVVADHPEITAADHTAHADIGFVLNAARDDSIIWDCASGFGATEVEATSSAAQTWLRTTAPVILELLSGTGELADHYSSADSGLTGRHAIHGAILGWGRGEGPDVLQRWWLEHPVLPELARTIRPEVWPDLGGLRVFFGSQGGESTAQATLNGEPITAARDLLLELNWPRFHEPAFVRSFVLVIPES